MSPDALYCGSPVPPADLALAWRFDPWAAAALLALVWLGRKAARGLLLAAAGVLALLYFSPLCALAAGLFSARAAHHLLLVGAAAPLLALAFPSRDAARAAAALGPLLLLQTATLWLWHWPAAYAVGTVGALPYWTMQASLLLPAALFWRAALAAPAGAALAALLLAGLQMGMLAALLVFADRPLYLAHLLAAPAFGLDALEDQQLAGLLMWVPGALPYLGAAALIAWRGLRSAEAAAR